MGSILSPAFESMEMPIVETNPASFHDDRSRAALDFVHSLLTGSTSVQSSVAELLEELSRVFAASGAGLAQWPAGSVVARTGHPNETASPLPWHDRPELLTQIRSFPRGIQVPGSNGKAF